MKITVLGTGSWGFALAHLLATNGHRVTSWTSDPELANTIHRTRIHPRFPEIHAPDNLQVTHKLTEALKGAEMVVESVTAAGIRPVLLEVINESPFSCPLVITSKGIEQNTGLILPEVAKEILGKNAPIGLLSGPSYAQEVIRGLPASVVATAYDPALIEKICDTFTTGSFRVYPNTDILGVALGGALKNIIAIACGISDGLQFGHSARAALMTRGLHEIRKLAVAMGCESRTITGLAGLGDLCLTCSSPMSRNYRFGLFVAEGISIEEAKEKIGMVVEGFYTSLAALQLSQENRIPMPITEMVYQILYEHLKPKEAVKLLMQRSVKEEHL